MNGYMNWICKAGNVSLRTDFHTSFYTKFKSGGLMGGFKNENMVGNPLVV